MVIAPVRVPVAVGVKVTLMAQLAPAATDVPQVLVCMKSPLATMLVTLSATVPVLVSVTDCATRSEEHTSELQSRLHLVCRLLLEKKKTQNRRETTRTSKRYL